MDDDPISMQEFKQLVREVMDSLPEEIRQYTENVVVEVAEWPDDELLLRAGFTEEEIEAGEEPAEQRVERMEDRRALLRH